MMDYVNKIFLFLIYFCVVFNTLANKGNPGNGESVEIVKSNVEKNVLLNEINNLIDNEEIETAHNRLKTILTEYSNDPDLNNLFGYTHRKLGKYKEAIDAYKKALSLDPNHTGTHNYIGHTYLKMGFFDKAKYHLEMLDLICLLGCEDFEDLAEAITKHRNKESW